MKNIRKLFIGSLALVLVATSIMTFAARSTLAAAGDNPRCECIQTSGSGSGIGTWISRVDGATANSRVDQAGNTICLEVGISGSCNPLTDTFISPGF
jgi:hypothetical protein